jgi:Tfp pilus assembly protein PilW
MTHLRLRRATVAVLLRARGERGLTVVEVLAGCAIMSVVTGAIALLIGTSVQSKVISASRSADTQTARATVAWMAERLRQAGFDVLPSAQSQVRCQDRVVAQDSLLLPTSNSVYVTGNIYNDTTTSPPYPVITIGYYLAADPGGSGHTVVMEYNQPCSSGSTVIATYSTRLSNPKINVTSLTFHYFDTNGNAVTNLTSASTIREIQIINVSMTVQRTEGRSGVQTQTFQENVKLLDPEPNANDWQDLNENF